MRGMSFRRHAVAWATLTALAILAGPAAAVQPASALGDHMVLQRGKAVPVWGTAAPGEKVAVRFAGQAVSAVAGADGRWMVRLAAMEPSTESRELAIEAASGSVTLKDVRVGDVWIAGGQSNMGRQVRSSWTPPDQRLSWPHIRFLTVQSHGSKYPHDELAPPPPPASPPREPRATLPNRWHVCTDQTTPECCAVGFFFAERIYRETGIPQGLLWNAWAGSTAKEWIPRFGWRLRPELADTAATVDAWYPGTDVGRAAYRLAVDEIAAWSKGAAEAVRKAEPFPFPQPLLPEPDDAKGTGRGTTILYNGRVHPLVPYAVRGLLWYQGESDYANRRYVPEIEALAESWRTLFAAPGEKPADLPFYFVQMQRCGSYMSPEIRDQQLQSYYTIPNAGMAVLLDLDMNLHPSNKYDSGRRLALWALAKDYGRKVAYCGPLYRSHRREGQTIVVEFTHADGGLFIGAKDKLDEPKPLPDGKLVNVEITADGRQWQPAQSRIDGERLIVRAEGLSQPTDVRYCWKSQADGPFLYGRSGLPAAQFNTASPYAFDGRRPPGDAPPPREPKDEKRRPREVELADVFGEGCVLQRGLPVPVWGLASPGEKVTVTFAGQSKAAEADRFGRWRVELAAMPASAEGRALDVDGPSNSVRLGAVYVGDVWLYLSQSWHLDTDKPPLDVSGLPPISTQAAASVWEHQNHGQRPVADFGGGERWSVYKPPGKYFRNDGFWLGAGLARATKAPVGIVSLGASTLESMTPPQGFAAYENALGELARTVATWTPEAERGRQAYLSGIAAIDDWADKTRAALGRAEVTFRDLAQPPPLPGPPRYDRGPTTAYNFLIHRYTPMAFRGVIIQPKAFGVGDRQYRLKAEALIAGLRKACGRDELPVCFVQMHSPDRNDRQAAADPNAWATLRDAQSALAGLPHTTVVAAYDLQAPGRSEPDAGLRAAQWAAGLVRGDAVLTGPTYQVHRVEGGRVVVELDNVGEGLMVGKPSAGRAVEPVAGGTLGGFQLAGADGKWRDASAAIEGKSVLVTCGEVPRPAAVRYAWAPEPKSANLYNRAGFPGLPFLAPRAKAH